MDERRRKSQRIFLAVSGVLVCAILVVAAEVLLPFVLGLLVAYVLLPAVVRVEQLYPLDEAQIKYVTVQSAHFTLHGDPDQLANLTTALQWAERTPTTRPSSQ